eukprot:g44974.t1
MGIFTLSFIIKLPHYQIQDSLLCLEIMQQHESITNDELMWEIRKQSSVPDDNVCRKCDQLQLLTDRIVQLERQLDTLGSRQGVELSKVGWGRLFAGKRASEKWEDFISEIMRVQGQHVLVRVKGVTQKVDEGSTVDVVDVDFTKAFDKVPHGSMVSKFADGIKIGGMLDSEEGMDKELNSRGEVRVNPLTSKPKLTKFSIKELEQSEILWESETSLRERQDWLLKVKLSGKSTFHTSELFKDLLMKSQDQRVPIRKKDKDGKKDMEDSEICVEYANMQGHFQIKKEVVLGLLKRIKVDKCPKPAGIYP